MKLKLLCDECMPEPVVVVLRNAGIETSRVEKGSSDTDILKMAHKTRQILVTLDKDFGELAIRRNLSHSGIIRLAGMGIADQARMTLQVLKQYSSGLADGALITATTEKVRIRRKRRP